MEEQQTILCQNAAGHFKACGVRVKVYSPIFRKYFLIWKHQYQSPMQARAPRPCSHQSCALPNVLCCRKSNTGRMYLFTIACQHHQTNHSCGFWQCLSQWLWHIFMYEKMDCVCPQQTCVTGALFRYILYKDGAQTFRTICFQNRASLLLDVTAWNSPQRTPINATT